MSVEVPTAPWVHIWDAQAQIAEQVAYFSRRYNAPQELRIAVRWPTKEDGCWCYRRSPRPHEHRPALGGCPVNPAGDNYVALEIAKLENSDPEGVALPPALLDPTPENP